MSFYPVGKLERALVLWVANKKYKVKNSILIKWTGEIFSNKLILLKVPSESNDAEKKVPFSIVMNATMQRNSTWINREMFYVLLCGAKITDSTEIANNRVKNEPHNFEHKIMLCKVITSNFLYFFIEWNVLSDSLELLKQKQNPETKTKITHSNKEITKSVIIKEFLCQRKRKNTESRYDNDKLQRNWRF